MVYRRYELVARSNDLFGPLRIEIPGALSRRVELLLQPLAQRIGGHQGLQLADELRVTPQREIRLDPVFHHPRP